MGASPSIVGTNPTTAIEDNNYISYAKGDVCGETIYDELLRLNFNMIQGQGILDAEGFKDNQNNESFTTLVEGIMKDSIYIIICISKKTTASYHQAIEMNAALDSKKMIVYVMTDKDYTPQNTHYLYGVVKRNVWLPGYNETTIEMSLKTLASMCDISIRV